MGKDGQDLLAGVIVEQGSPEEVFGAPREERTRQFLARYAQE